MPVASMMRVLSLTRSRPSVNRARRQVFFPFIHGASIRPLALLALALQALAPSPAPGQEILEVPTPGGTTREALVLSGGGSRGLAHAGALEGLQRLGHDPDMVVGTSIGALVGALYAAGYPPEEIQRQIDAADWGEMFTPPPLLLGPDRLTRYPLLTFDREVSPLRFSRGFIPQWRINRALARLLFDANARSRGDFDRLARRYRAVTTDLQTGDTVILGRGDLARAARASMAVPGVFSPIEWDGRFLVDGGIADNVPTEVALEMGANRVIVVDVGRTPAEITGRTPLQVAGRGLDLLQENADSGSPEPDDLVLPDIPANQQGVTFPGDPTPLFRLGLDATLRDLGRSTLGRAAARLVPSPPVRFGELRVEAPNPGYEALVRGVFGPVVRGPYDAHRVVAAIDRLYASGLVEAVWARVEEGAGDPALVVRAEAPPKTSLAVAVGYDSDRGGRAWGALERGVLLLSAPGVLTAAASADLLEQWVSASSRVYLPRWPLLSGSAGAFFKETDARLFEEGDPSGDQEVRRAGSWIGADLQDALSGRTAGIALRGEWLDVEGGTRGFSFGPLLHLTTRPPEAPVVGAPLTLQLETRIGEVSYSRVEARASRSARRGPLHLALVGSFAAATASTPPDELPALGDEHAFPGLRWGEARDRALAIAGADAAHSMPFGGFLRLRVRAGGVAPTLAELDRGDAFDFGGDVGALWSTPFGALSLAWGTSTLGISRIFLEVGTQ